MPVLLDANSRQPPYRFFFPDILPVSLEHLTGTHENRVLIIFVDLKIYHLHHIIAVIYLSMIIIVVLSFFYLTEFIEKKLLRLRALN